VDESRVEVGARKPAFEVSLICTLCFEGCDLHLATKQSTKYQAQSTIPLPNAVKAKETTR
jgi:hypothetical protein